MKTQTQSTSTQRSSPSFLLKWNTRYSKKWKSFPKDAGPCTTNLQRYHQLSFTATRSRLFSYLKYSPPHFTFSIQETSPSTSWQACCRGTNWTSVWRVWRRRWASRVPAVLQGSMNRRGSSRVTVWSQTDWFQRTIPTTSWSKVRWCVVYYSM